MVDPATDARATLIFVHGGGDDTAACRTADSAGARSRGAPLRAADDRSAASAAPMVRRRHHLRRAEANDVIGAVDFLGPRSASCQSQRSASRWRRHRTTRRGARASIRAVIADSAFADVRDVATAFTHAATGLPTFVAAAFVWSAEHVHRARLARAPRRRFARRHLPAGAC